MKIEISDITQMRYEEFLQFKMLGNPNYVFDIIFPDTMSLHMETIQIWMEKIDAFPIYFCIQIINIHTNDFELICNENSLDFEYIGKCENLKVAILEILNSESFSVLFPFIKLTGSMEDLVFWSSRRDCFSVDKKRRPRGLFDLVNINFDVETTVFSLIQAGTLLEVYSNSSFFNSYEDIVNSLPDFSIPIKSEE
ncbi:hypothetical protein B1B04_02890 [Lysinibacillus sp. KCTC 33748]|uniref:hypothetical protein n=1 Tax=unclassified Lysinibacillus TaxID=2636778 RepID=UPI0009A815A7|nr:MULTISPECIES: hypothetical protein [unclassified Lysinibacillus]OXS75958.1 hypothetical protein B1B04_02890 [Lysinibacillus sp. KCTC 33748]SKB37216.1 hypothetical protein SAMN06295926_10233 [Lysinibacillus sp. AC-3]